MKILNDKIKPNQAQYVLGKNTAKISALSSGELEKYEHLNREDSGYKPGVVKKKLNLNIIHWVKFLINDQMKKTIKKKLKVKKRLKNIEGQDKEQLNAINGQGENQLQILAKQIKKLTLKIHLLQVNQIMNH